jgi:cytochrome c oxidase subunit II
MINLAQPTQAAPSPRINVESWLPKQGSTFAPSVDWAWDVVTIVCTLFFLLLMGMMFYFAIAYRRRTENDVTSDLDHNFRLEVAWTVIPLVLCAGLFFIGFKGFVHASVAPADSIEIKVVASKWKWEFFYPGSDESSADLVVPADRPVKMIMSSQDVLHAFFVPEFRVKRDIIPGMYTTVWFEATQPLESVLQCAEYCGGAGDGSRSTGHSGMWAHVKVLPGAEYDAWLQKREDDLGKMDPVARGRKLFQDRGCMGCHSLDGSRINGPTFKGLWGRDEKFTDGTSIKVEGDAGLQYLRDSIMNPQLKIVDTYPSGVMPPFQGQLNEKQLNALIEFIKEQK